MCPIAESNSLCGGAGGYRRRSTDKAAVVLPAAIGRKVRHHHQLVRTQLSLGLCSVSGEARERRGNFGEWYLHEENHR